MAKKRSDVVDWRRFEQLVFVCESVLASEFKNVKVKFDDRVRGVSRRSRQCDATIRVDAGSTELLIILECRKRRTPQDVRWVEEASGKRNLLKAARIILISERGFAAPAIEAARHLDVELRTLAQITEADIRDWLPSTALLALGYHRNVIDVRINTEPLPGAPPGEVTLVNRPRREAC